MNKNTNSVYLGTVTTSASPPGDGFENPNCAAIYRLRGSDVAGWGADRHTALMALANELRAVAASIERLAGACPVITVVDVQEHS